MARIHNLNRQILGRLPKATNIRQPMVGCSVERLSFSVRQDWSLRWRRELARFWMRLALQRIRSTEIFDRLAWKFRDVPAGTQRILDIGCGDGLELVFLRAAAPEARILAVDWLSESLPLRTVHALGIEFRKVDVSDYLETTSETFDLVFSNHVLEHMYEPDHALAMLRRRVSEGGRMIAALPLDGQGACLADTLARLTGTLPLCWVYFGSIDLGHPWKTTPADLKESLVSAGFANVRMVQQEQHLTRLLAVDEAGLDAFRMRARRLQRFFLEPLKALLATIFGNQAPFPLMRLFYAFESRIWFGANRLKNAESPEILVIAD